MQRGAIGLQGASSGTKPACLKMACGEGVAARNSRGGSAKPDRPLRRRTAPGMSTHPVERRLAAGFRRGNCVKHPFVERIAGAAYGYLASASLPGTVSFRENATLYEKMVKS
jgi:hypothetical protein